MSAARRGRLLWVTFLGEARKVTSRRATPASVSARRRSPPYAFNKSFGGIRYAIPPYELCAGDNVPMKVHRFACRSVLIRVDGLESLQFREKVDALRIPWHYSAPSRATPLHGGDGPISFT